MLRYIIKRFFQTLLTLFLVVTFVFILLRFIGDPSKLMVSPQATAEDLAHMRAVLGLDQPLWVQYIDYLKSIVTGDLGMSYYYVRPVTDLIAETLPATLILSGVAFLFAVPIALLSGTIAAVKRNSILDNTVTTLTIAGKSMPAFWVGLLMMLLLSVKFRLLPPSGYGLKELIMPAITLGMGLSAGTARMTRSAMLDTLRQDYMTTARAKGNLERRTIIVHGLRNALLSVVTMLALQLGGLISGSVLVESIFGWPGIGRLMVSAINQFDYPLVQACALMMATVYAVVNFITDLLYTVIDPRISYR